MGILFGLLCALCWGTGDFIGGIAARRDAALRVLIGASLAGIGIGGFLGHSALPDSKRGAWRSV